VNFWYGRQKKLKSVSIGTVWKPQASARTDVANAE
jgi:preprotein translocase subunit SecD